MKKENVINKKKVFWCIGIFFLLIILIIFLIFPKTKTGINGVVLGENVNLYSKPLEDERKKIATFEEKSNVFILNSLIEDGKQWYEIEYNGEKGYVLSENIDYYKKPKDKYLIVADFSSHNMIDIFENENDVEAFLLKYDVAAVYIRAGGRGYGKKGNFYTDEKYDIFVNACKYLGIQYGFYFLDEALDNSEINEEVEFISKFMKENSSPLCTLPIALDIESHEGEGRCDSVWDSRSMMVKKLIKKLKVANFETIVYSNANTCNKYLSTLNTKFWLAYYPEEDFVPDYWYTETKQPGVENKSMISKMVGWQFSENGVNHVIKEGIDLSIFKNDFLK